MYADTLSVGRPVLSNGGHRFHTVGSDSQFILDKGTRDISNSSSGGGRGVKRTSAADGSSAALRRRCRRCLHRCWLMCGAGRDREHVKTDMDGRAGRHGGGRAGRGRVWWERLRCAAEKRAIHVIRMAAAAALWLRARCGSRWRLHGAAPAVETRIPTTSWQHRRPAGRSVWPRPLGTGPAGCGA